MVARLAQRLRGGGFEHCEAQVMDGQALDLADGSFDADFSIFGVMLFPDWERGLSELARVVRPGGRGCVAVWSREEGAGPSLAFHAAYRAAFPDRPAPSSAPGMARLKNPITLAAAVHEAGFRDVQVHEVTGCWQAPSVEWVIDKVGPFSRRSPAFAELTDTDRTHLEEGLRNELAWHCSGGSVAIHSDALVGPRPADCTAQRE